MKSQRSPADFNRLFLAGFAVWVFTLVMVYLAAVTFGNVSATGAKYADMVVPFLLATAIGGIFSFFYAVNKAKDPETPDQFPQATSLSIQANGVKAETKTPAPPPAT